jgi:hypothetical protein
LQVLLQRRALPKGTRQLPCFSSLHAIGNAVSALSVGGTDTCPVNWTEFNKSYMYAGLAVTPFTPRLGSTTFDQGQGFVACFSGLNVVTVKDKCRAGDILVAVPPLKKEIGQAMTKEGTHISGKHTGAVMSVVTWEQAKDRCCSSGTTTPCTTEHLQQWVVGRCVGGAAAGFRATVSLCRQCTRMLMLVCMCRWCRDPTPARDPIKRFMYSLQLNLHAPPHHLTGCRCHAVNWYVE